jgi:hypothetical protein
MGKVKFTVKSYSAFHTAEVSTFAEAEERATRWACEGGLPSTILDTHGCRWTVQAGHGWVGAPALQDCPAIEAGLARECLCDGHA